MCDRELPRYQSHKIIHALKIAMVQAACGDRPAAEGEENDGGAIITPVEEGYAPFRVDRDYMTKHGPKVGGYCLVYGDGYKSWSPAEATWLKCPAETSTTDKIVKAVTNGLAWPWLAWKRWKARKAEKEE